MSNDDSVEENKFVIRLSMNTRLSTARIFDEDSNSSEISAENNHIGKMRSSKQNVKSSPYEDERNRKPKIEYETDPAIIERRQKQIDYGKNTACYDNYIKMVPKEERTKEHPRTPIKHIKYSRRGWDGLIKHWRQKLHEFDQENLKDKDNSDESEMKKQFEEAQKKFVDLL